MLYRVLVAGIIGFWVLMGALLVRTELFPERGRSLPVPVGYVGQLIFRHEETSDLALYSQRRRLEGDFHLQPRRKPPADSQTTPGNLLNVSGNFLLSLPGAPSQHVVFHSSLEFDDRAQVRRVELSASAHEPKQTGGGVTLHLDGSPLENRWHYQLTQGSETLSEGQGTPEEMIAALDLRSYGLDPRIFSQASAQAASATMTARHGTLRVNDEDVETYVVTIHHAESLDSEIYVNQLGQILAVKTFLHYDLYDESLLP